MGERTVCFIDLSGGAGICTKELIGEPIDCDKCEFKKKFEGQEKKHFIYTHWTGELNQKKKGDKVRELIRLILDLIYEIDEEALRDWIYEKWPHGYGIYD